MVNYINPEFVSKRGEQKMVAFMASKIVDNAKKGSLEYNEERVICEDVIARNAEIIATEIENEAKKYHKAKTMDWVSNTYEV